MMRAPGTPGARPVAQAVDPGGVEAGEPRPDGLRVARELCRDRRHAAARRERGCVRRRRQRMPALNRHPEGSHHTLGAFSRPWK